MACLRSLSLWTLPVVRSAFLVHHGPRWLLRGSPGHLVGVLVKGPGHQPGCRSQARSINSCVCRAGDDHSDREYRRRVSRAVEGADTMRCENECGQSQCGRCHRRQHQRCRAYSPVSGLVSFPATWRLVQHGGVQQVCGHGTPGDGAPAATRPESTPAAARSVPASACCAAARPWISGARRRRGQSEGRVLPVRCAETSAVTDRRRRAHVVKTLVSSSTAVQSRSSRSGT